MVLFHYYFFSTRPLDEKSGSILIYFFHLYMTIWPKIMVLINLFLLIVHNHSTKVRGHSYFLIYYFLNCANISFAIFKAALPLYFVHSIHRGAALTLIFHTLYSWKCCSYISYAMPMAIWSLSHLWNFPKFPWHGFCKTANVIRESKV